MPYSMEFDFINTNCDKLIKIMKMFAEIKYSLKMMSRESHWTKLYTVRQ